MVRRDVHARYGGRRQGGIGPSRSTPNVLLFTDPERGRAHGYFDGWGDDGCFHYTGEGQLGDQQMVQGNLSILRHREQGRALRLFRAAQGGVEYLGPFEVDPDHPWYTSEAPETGGGPIRTVIMFRLRPQGLVQSFDAPLPATPTAVSRVISVPVEISNTAQYGMTTSGEPTTAFRREATLVHSYADHLRALGHEVCRKQIVPANESRPLFTDLYDATANELIEAKGTVTREAIRMGIGQLLDYGRFIDPPPRLALLVPSKPRPDLLELCATVDVTAVWKIGNEWQRTPPAHP
ncbi:restriction endonuclease [Frankia sp. R43]|nr:restriction endonuclease [Frankia sp. R43]